MGKWIKAAVLTAGAALTLTAPGAGEAGAVLNTSLSSDEVVKPPYGYVQFCHDFPSDCRGGRRTPRVMVLTDQRWQELNKINRAVNHVIQPATDQELYHVADFWTYPITAGDCEDYQILKRKMLIKHGWPEEALLITVVKDHHGDGHAILSVRTDRGEYMLDNMTDEIVTWRETDYTFVKRQAEWDPTVWVKIVPPIS